MTGGARGGDFWEKRKGWGAAGPDGPKVGGGGARLGRRGGERGGGGWAASWAGRRGGLGRNGKGREGEKKKRVFFF